MRWQRARVGVWLAAQTRVDLGVEPEPFPDPAWRREPRAEHALVRYGVGMPFVRLSPTVLRTVEQYRMLQECFRAVKRRTWRRRTENEWRV